MLEVKKAELIEGVVYLASLLRHRPHGKPHFRLIAWLGTYEAMTQALNNLVDTDLEKLIGLAYLQMISSLSVLR